MTYCFSQTSKKTLWEWHARIMKRLENLRLLVHKGAHPRPVTEGFPFLGFVLYPRRRRLKRRKGIYYQRKYRRMLKAFHAGDLSLTAVSASVRGWVNHVRYGNTVGLRKAVLSCTPTRPRVDFDETNVWTGYRLDGG